MQQTNSNPLSTDIYGFFGNNKFLKIKNNSFNIGMVLFSFVTTDEEMHAIKEQSFDCYLSFADSLRLCTDIIFGKISAKAEQERAKGNKYPNAVWTSGLGGVNEENAKARGLRTDGKAVSRTFSIVPGQKPFVFIGQQGSGHSDEGGLIVPEKTELKVYVPVESEAELKNMAESLQMAIYAYTTAKYSKFYNFTIYSPTENMSQEKSEKSDNASQKNSDLKPDSKISATSNKEPKENAKSQTNSSNVSGTTTVACEMKHMTAAGHTEVLPTRGNGEKMCMQIVDEKSNILTLIFLPEDIKKVEPAKWQKFVKLLKEKGKRFSFNYVVEQSNGREYLYFKGFH